MRLEDLNVRVSPPIALTLSLLVIALTIALLHVFEGGWMPQELS